MIKFKELISFKGRARRRTYLFSFLAFWGGTIIIGMISGVIMATNQMDFVLDRTKFCDEVVSEGRYSGSCEELIYISRDFEKAIQQGAIYPEHHIATITCTEYKKLSLFRGNCDEAIPLLLEMHSKDSSTKRPGINPVISVIMIILIIIWVSPVFVILLSVTSKRLHDLGFSGWWQILPFVAKFLSSSMVGQAGLFFFILGILFQLIIFIQCAFIKGKPGSNKYGPNPLESLSS